MQCERCRKIVPNESIKMVPKQVHEAVCSTCRGEAKITSNPRRKLVVENLDEASKKRILYFCERCNYKFRHNTASSVRLYCPWCGQGDKSSTIE